MQNQELLNQVTQQLQRVSTSSSITTGDKESAVHKLDDNQRDAINQVFALLRFNYHNQFLKAFPDLETVKLAKQLWARLLVDYPAETIMFAAEQVVKQQKFLPNVHDMIEACQSSAHKLLGMPDAHSAYVEACRAPSPKKEYNWSHPAVYFAGRASDWFFLANSVEAKAFPVFERNYVMLMERVAAGESIELELPKALPENIEVPIERKDLQKKMKQLLQDTGL
ncbi:MAG TPA: hypothetical protein DIC30_00660 [Oceanospirillales bacterium]|nr:hypothetical protein [Oleispira sp.]HCM04496.1 hypothetical protein [Oceanospirillales bacterium]|tara:strand:- start:276 stop:947 length:672 start_codon:yes stop_codon:yes gene_type:complete